MSINIGSSQLRPIANPNAAPGINGRISATTPEARNRSDK
jgi:hypothetical protein